MRMFGIGESEGWSRAPPHAAEQLTAKGWPVVPIDAGNQVRRFGRQSEIKFQITVEGLTKMGYRAIAFGPDDLRLPGLVESWYGSERG